MAVDLSREDKITHVPTHVGIILDGNGRWAQRRGLPRLRGHEAGAKNIGPVVAYLEQCQVKYVTLYAFSTENWKRPEDEVRGIFSILQKVIDSRLDEVCQRGVRLRHLGRLQGLPERLQASITKAVEQTADNTGLTFSLAFNYGGRTEILDAVRRIMTEAVKPQDINEELFHKYLYTSGMPDVDLIIRTGAELRISNFLTWQSVYSEFYFTEVLWPDFSRDDVDEALLSYSSRQRRFGGL